MKSGKAKNRQMKIVLEDLSSLRFAFYFPYKESEVKFCQALRSLYGSNSIFFSTKGGKKRWVFFNPAFVSLISEAYPGISLDAGVTSYLKNIKKPLSRKLPQRYTVKTVKAKAKVMRQKKGGRTEETNKVTHIPCPIHQEVRSRFLDIDSVGTGSQVPSLRPYQKEAVCRALNFFLDENSPRQERPVLVLPMGSGKSIISAFLARALQPRGGVLVLQPSKELLEQNYEKFLFYGGEAKIFSASMNTKEIGSVTFATIGSIRKIPERFSHVRYVIVDEAHLVPPDYTSMYVSFLKRMRNIKVVGLTATPFRLKNYLDLEKMRTYTQINLLPYERPRFFTSIIHITQIKDLYQGNYLAPVKYFFWKWSDAPLKVNSTGGEYTEESIEIAMKKNGVLEKIKPTLDSIFAQGKKHALVFVKSVRDAEALSRQIPLSAYVHAKTPKEERKKIIDAFKKGTIKVVFNVSVLTTGFDFPELDAIIIARPTMSLGLFMQMAGRGIRTSPGKEDCALVDLCGNLNRFGKLHNIFFFWNTREGKWELRNEKRKLSGVRMYAGKNAAYVPSLW